MVFNELDEDLPEWVREVIPMNCTYCGSSIVNNHDENGVYTVLKCFNPKCPGHMSYKMDYVAKYFDIKGFGPATALEWINLNKPKSHLEILDEWFEEKPTETLSRIADLACIEGLGYTNAQKFMDTYASFSDMFERANNLPDVVEDNKEILLEAETHFNIAKPLAADNLYVMATGSIHGFINRDAFFAALNDEFGEYIHIIQTGPRKTGVACLIKEKDAVDHKKSRYAKESGIPIYTPLEFVQRLTASVEYNKKKESESTPERNGEL